MIDYGFQAVRDSLKDMERFHAKSVGAAMRLRVQKTGPMAESPTSTRADHWQH
jgi:hypothetical protein